MSNSMNQQALRMDPAFKKKGILVVAAVLVGFMLQAIMTNDSTNILTMVLPNLRGWTQTMITLPATVGGWCALAVTVLAGTLVKRIGSYNCLKIGYIILGIALICIGTIDSYPVYFVALLATRCGQALGFFSSVTLCTDWFLAYRGTVLGIVTMGPPISSAALVPAMTLLVNNLGFNVGWIGMGVVAFIFVIFLCICGKSTPEDYGWQQDGFKRSAEELSKMGMDDGTPNIWTLPRMLKKKEYWILTIAGALGGMTFGSGLMLFIPVVTSAGIDPALALTMFSVGSALAIPFSFVSGILDDKFGTKPAFLVVFSVTFLMPLSMALLIATGLLVFGLLSAFFCGILAGCLMNMNPSIKQWAFGRKAFVDFNRTAQAVENACQTLGVLVLSIFMDLTGTYLTGFIFIAILMAVVFFFTVTIRSHAPEVITFEKAKQSAGLA